MSETYYLSTAKFIVEDPEGTFEAAVVDEAIFQAVASVLEDAGYVLRTYTSATDVIANEE